MLDTIDELRTGVNEGCVVLERGDRVGLMQLIDRNFDLRCRIFPVEAIDREMVELARAHRAVAKLCGSGGAVLILASTDAEYGALEAAYRGRGFQTFRPVIR